MFRENHWNIDMVVATIVLALALSRYPIHRLSSYQHLDTLQEEAVLYCYGEGEVTTSADSVSSLQTCFLLAPETDRDWWLVTGAATTER